MAKSPLFLLALFLLSSAWAHAGETLTFGKPVDMVAEISSRVLEEAYRRAGVNIRFVELPAERSLLKANEGSLDGDVNRVAGIEARYVNLIRVPTPINSVEQIVVSKNHNFRVDGWESLKPYSIAIRIGTKVVESGTAGMNVTAFPTYEKVFELLVQDRYDICVAGRTTALAYIKKYKLKDLRLLEPPLTKRHLYHYLHKNHQTIVETINSVLQEMQQEGAIVRARELAMQKLLNGS